MRIVEGFQQTPPFETIEPAPVRVPVVFNSPHSGQCYPRDFLRSVRLDRQAIRRSEDTYVDELFADVVALGAPLMRANFPRVFIDVNREPYELDPAMFVGELPRYANSASARVAGGLGTIARVVADAQEIYRAPLTVAQAIERIEAYYKPYHEALEALIARMAASFGCVLLVDCHSMPSAGRGAESASRPDVIIGDRYGTSCAPCLADAAGRIFARLGYQVGRNRPYAGGYITEKFGRPAAGLHALQIEISRSLYMDEATNAKSSRFDAVRTDLAAFADALVRVSDEFASNWRRTPIAAE